MHKLFMLVTVAHCYDGLFILPIKATQIGHFLTTLLIKTKILN